MDDVGIEAGQTAESELHLAGGAGVMGNSDTSRGESNGAAGGVNNAAGVGNCMLGWVGIPVDESDEPTPPDPYAWSLRCPNPCAMSCADKALVIITSQTFSTPAEVSCSNVVSTVSSTPAGCVRLSSPSIEMLQPKRWTTLPMRSMLPSSLSCSSYVSWDATSPQTLRSCGVRSKWKSVYITAGPILASQK
ncbi:hypothetical protein PIB30_044297 [Stylosanthes scabra]|uniref:Uncharacterized protein n=1 Tax=Stylosanthes scabra TaxID=79078 RepID=A0ABU6VE73_9FABA|nr:hypothetical protein [Stylosanthes scabra]